MANITLFSQIFSKLDRLKFSKLVNEKEPNKHQKRFNNWTLLVSMLFCQFAKKQSLRNISNGLRSSTGNLNHLGIERAPSKSTIGYQNKNRDWETFRAFYYQLLESLGQRSGFKQIKFKIKTQIYLITIKPMQIAMVRV